MGGGGSASDRALPWTRTKVEAENGAALAIQGRWRASHREQTATMMPAAPAPRGDTEDELRDKLDDPAEGLLTNKEKLDECRNSLQLQCTMHLVASAFYEKYYYFLAIPSIALSSFLSVIGYILPPAQSEMYGAILNSCNTIALGLLALLKYQSKADLHENAAASLQSLKVQVQELRDELDHLIQGTQHDSTVKAMEVFLRTFHQKFTSIYAKNEEIADMAPIDPKFVEQAQRLHIQIYSGELRILNSGRVPAKRHQQSRRSSFGFGGAPPRRSSFGFGGAPPSAEADDSAAEPSRSLATAARTPPLPGGLAKKRGSSMLDVVKTARVDRRSVVDMSNGRLEYNEAKLEQLASMLHMMTMQHLLCGQFFMKWYYALAIPSIAVSAFLAILGYLVPKELQLMASASLNAMNTIVLGVLALLRYQSKMDLHQNAAKALQALRMSVLKIRDKMNHLNRGMQHESVTAENQTFFKGFLPSLATIYAKAEEIAETAPIPPSVQLRAQALHVEIEQMESEIRCLHLDVPDIAPTPTSKLQKSGSQQGFTPDAELNGNRKRLSFSTPKSKSKVRPDPLPPGTEPGALPPIATSKSLASKIKSKVSGSSKSPVDSESKVSEPPAPEAPKSKSKSRKPKTTASAESAEETASGTKPPKPKKSSKAPPPPSEP